MTQITHDNLHESPIRRIPVAIRILAMTAVVLVTSFASASKAQSVRHPTDKSDGDGIVRIEAKPNIDENLFLVRALENFYGALPQFEGDIAAFRGEVESTRQDLKLHMAYIRENGIDKSIGEMYSDFMKVLDSYEESLLKILDTGRKAETSKEDSFTRDVTKSSFVGGEMAGGALASGVDPLSAVGIWAVGGLTDYFLNTEDKTGAIEEAKASEIESIAKRYQKTTEEAISNTRSRCKSLARAHGWTEDEYGFDNDPRFAQTISKAIEQGAYQELLRLRSIECRKRPNDPFARNARALAIIFKKDVKPGEMMQSAEECLEAASLIPPGRFYDAYRQGFIGLSAILASGAVQNESSGKGWISGPYPSAGRAVQICKTYLHYDELDESGEGRMTLAWNLASQGQTKEALKTAESVMTLQAGNPDFLYGLASLLSLDGQVDEAFDVLEVAINKAGFYGIDQAKTDPDLAKVRERKRSEFEELTRVKFEWSIDWGILSDDICVVNRSFFPLTNVRFEARVTSDGYSDWNETFTADAILPGQTVRWNTRVGARGEKHNAKAMLTADQNR